MTEPIKIFFCCATTPRDQALRDQLEAHIMVLKRLNEITLRLTRKLDMGKNWKYEQDHRFQTADLILLLISPDFICSNYHYGIEMSHALEKHAAGNVLVIPILLRPTPLLEKLPLGGLQFLPKDGKAITEFKNRDTVCAGIVKEVSQAVTTLLLRKQAPVFGGTNEKRVFPKNTLILDGALCRSCGARNAREAVICEICADVLLIDMIFSQKPNRSPDEQGATEVPKSAVFWSTCGFVCYGQERLDEARQMFDHAMHLDDKYAPAYFGKGQIFYAERRLNQALEMFDRAIRYHPVYIEALVRRGNVVDELGDYNLAIQCYNQALRLNAHNAQAWSGKASALYQLSDYYEALKAYRFAIDLDPNDALLWKGKGDALYSLNNYAEALTAYEHVLQLDPHLTTAWHNKALMLIRLRRHADALQAAEEAIRQQSDNPDHWQRKAEALKGLRRRQESKNAQMEANRLKNTPVKGFVR